MQNHQYQHIQVNKTHIYKRRPSKKGILPDSDLDIRGREKRTVQSFQCGVNTWKQFGVVVERKYGKYKKSYVIESLIDKWIKANTTND